MKNKVEISQAIKEQIEKTFPHETFLIKALEENDAATVITRLKGLTSLNHGINFSARDIVRLFESGQSEVIKLRADQVIKGEEFLRLLLKLSRGP